MTSSLSPLIGVAHSARPPSDHAIGKIRRVANGQLLAETDDSSKEYSDCLDKAVKGAWADMFECGGEELDRQNARLNDNYKKLMSKLSRDRKKALLKAERAWIKFREANCDYYADPAGGRAEGLIASDCLATMTAKRAKELEAMLEGL